MTAILGILNMTPDSFSDGGRWQKLDNALAHAVQLHTAGADFIDVGGESTRPGAESIDPAEEQRRVLPVIRELVTAGIPVSIDTRNADVALAALSAGAGMINDVSGGLSDPRMVGVVADAKVPVIVMHWRGGADASPQYLDVLREVHDHLAKRIDDFLVAGVQLERIIIDPGLGFAKTAAHNWELLAGITQLTKLAPVLIGASRKRFLGELLSKNSPMFARDAPTATISALAAEAGVWGVRVHDVAATRLALDVSKHWVRGQ